ncbi:MAG: hypothetical protein ACYDEW_06355 [Vulcanimicrobiaceae bacterium]
MNAKGPRENAGRGIETSKYYDSTAIANPLSSGDHDERPRWMLRGYQCAAVEHVQHSARRLGILPTEAA